MDTSTEPSLVCSLAVWQELKKLVEKAAAELCDERHPHSKIAEQKHKSDKSERRGRGRPPTHGLSQRPIYRSFREAKRRCTDRNHRDFERYGGRGIEFRIENVTALFEAIGDRRANTTLDRIDPNGHYEIGNLRWASPKEQANNRRSSQCCRHSNISWRNETRERYLQTAQHWVLSIKGLNDPASLTSDEGAFLLERRAATGFPNATFSEEMNAVYEWRGFYKETVTLPSLNEPGGRLALNLNTFRQVPNSPLSGRGLLVGMVDVPLDVNCTRQEILLLNRFIADFRDRRGPPGLRFSGYESLDSIKRIEGRLMAMAGRLMYYDYKARLVTAAEVADYLSLKQTEPLLQNEFLFIPDLQVWPAMFGSDETLTDRLVQCLDQRARQGLPTVTYLESPNELGTIADIIFSWWFREARNN